MRRMTDGDHGHTSMIVGYRKALLGFGRIETAHLMGYQLPQRRRLQAKILAGGAGIMLTPAVGLAGCAECRRGYGQH